jgi:hypothetical protein
MGYGKGSMRHQVNYLRSNDRMAKAVLCWEGDTLIGCACIFGDGVGTAIVAHARRGRKYPLRACPWDDRSQSFYNPMIASGKVANAYAN